VIIYGKGKSGRAVAQLCNLLKIPYRLVDDNDKNISLEKEKLVVVSPGISPSHWIFQLSREKNVKIIGEVEFAYRFFQGDIIAITGTDGKTTTTLLIYHLLKALEEREPIRVLLGGNVGIPFSEVVYEVKKNKKTGVRNVAVLEISSFQGKTLKKFRPNIGVFLNFSEDHLSWHGSLRDYLESKYKIFENQTEKDFLIVNACYKETLLTPSRAKRIAFYYPCKRKIFSESPNIFLPLYRQGEKIYLGEDIVLIDLEKDNLPIVLEEKTCSISPSASVLEEKVLSTSPSVSVLEEKADYISSSALVWKKSSGYTSRSALLIGEHNLFNIAVALVVSLIYLYRLKNIPLKKLSTEYLPFFKENLKEFQPPKYRLEYLGVINGRKIYNDSKSTTPHALLYALKSFPDKVILILGGKDKGANFEFLREIFKEKVKTAIIYGENRHKIFQQLGNLKGIKFIKVEKLEEAVEQAFKNSKEKDIILFSPASASFDQFSSYEERGRIFEELVLKKFSR
jgi:UDP-N-acetylmuramoylalanine--D-glutamate ligase